MFDKPRDPGACSTHLMYELDEEIIYIYIYIYAYAYDHLMSLHKINTQKMKVF